MKKIPMLFTMDFDANGVSTITDRFNPVAIEAFGGTPADVVATRKFDGTATMLDADGNWFARRSVKPGKTAPDGFVLAEHDPNTGTDFGWEPMAMSPWRKMHKVAVTTLDPDDAVPGTTLELVGPKVNGNPEGVDAPKLIPHGKADADGFPALTDILAVGDGPDAAWDMLKPFFADFRARNIEGVVWWVNGAPVVKLRCKDFFPEMDPRHGKAPR